MAISFSNVTDQLLKALSSSSASGSYGQSTTLQGDSSSAIIQGTSVSASMVSPFTQTDQWGTNKSISSPSVTDKGALNAAMAQLRQDGTNAANSTQALSTDDGKKVLFRNVDGKAQFAVFNADGSQMAPSKGWQTIDPNVNGGKGSLRIDSAHVVNFDEKGLTVDATAKNPGTPLGIDASGNIGVGNGTEELTDSSINALSDSSISGASLKSFDVNLFPSGTPSQNDVNQKGLGDCYFDSTLAALASTPGGQEQLKNMIKPGKDPGTFDVTMHAPDGSPVKISVNSTFEAGPDGSLIGSGGKDGTANWASVLESAYAKYNDQYHVSGNDLQGWAGMDHGSADTNKAVMALTGNAGQTSIPLQQMSTSQIAQELTQHFSQSTASAGGGMTVGSPKEQTLPDGVHVAGGHAYSVLGFDPATQTVTVRNPWGSGYPGAKNSDGTPEAGDGTIKLTLDDFKQLFDSSSSWEQIGASQPSNSAPSGSLDAQVQQ